MISRERFWAPRGFWIAWIAGAVLSLPALRVGALSDDFFQHLVLEGSVPVPHLGPTTLYDFTAGQNVLPWIERPILAHRGSARPARRSSARGRR